MTKDRKAALAQTNLIPFPSPAPQIEVSYKRAKKPPTMIEAPPPKPKK